MEKGWKAVFITESEYEAVMAKNLPANAGKQSVIMNQHDTARQASFKFHVYTLEKDAGQEVESIKNLKVE